MNQFVKTNKKQVVIACAAIAICSVFVALYVAQRAKSNEKEPVPPGRMYDTGVFGDNIVVYDSTEGEIIIGAMTAENGVEVMPLADTLLKIASDPETIWNADTYAGNHTPIDKAHMKNGSIGILTIPKLNLSVNVYESPDNMEAMSKGVAHFPSSSAYDGNVALSAHNINFDGGDGYFKYLYTLQKGDSVTYQTALGERAYTVESITTIAASDWTPLNYTDDNRLTMITCISGQPDQRLCVTAIEKSNS